MRLTQEQRQTITAVLIKRALETDEAALKDLMHAAAAVAYTTMVDVNVVRILQDLPEGIAPEVSVIRVQIKQDYSTREDLHFSTPMRFPSSICDRWDKPEKLYKKTFPPAVQDYVDAKKALNNKRNALEESVRGVLASVTTWKKLYEIWPEAKNVLLKLEPSTGGANLPAVIPQELNAELKLP